MAKCPHNRDYVGILVSDKQSASGVLINTGKYNVFMTYCY